MRHTILVIEDEVEILDLIALYLGKEGYEAVLALDAETGLDILKKRDIDLVLLDLNLPGQSGFEFLRALRKEKELPVIIVSARSSDEDVVLGLGLGADEFVTKPFSPRVLCARVDAILRRSRLQPEAEGRTVVAGPFVIDPEAYFVRRGEVRISLSAREFELFAFLVKAQGKSFTPEELYDQVWGNVYGDLTAVGVYIQRIRKKIEADPSNPRYIQTVRGKGYRFCANPGQECA